MNLKKKISLLVVTLHIVSVGIIADETKETHDVKHLLRQIINAKSKTGTIPNPPVPH